MNQLLKVKQQVQCQVSKAVATVETFIAGGGQGEVYKALLGGSPLALKWYYPDQAKPEQRASLERLIHMGKPSDRFMWPIDLAIAPGVQGFGYLMPLLPHGFKGIVDLMKRRTEPDFRALVTVCYHLAHEFLNLHAKGYCYRDISFGNVQFDPKTGELLILDNDNVGVDGRAGGGVLGTPRFMAPEVVRGEAMPSSKTDLFSLAILLFYLLCVSHPLEGKREATIKCFDMPAMTKLYGTDPLFIYDPNKEANRPVPGFHDNALAFWPLYPEFIRNLFIRSFSDGIKDPVNGRVRESEWRKAMLQLRDLIFNCGHCGAENFLDPGNGMPQDSIKCWACKKDLIPPLRIRIVKNLVLLNSGVQLFPHHIDDRRMFDFSAPVAQVEAHPTDPKIWGLKNLSKEKWTIQIGDGPWQDVAPGKNARIASGLKIQWGSTTGEIING